MEAVRKMKTRREIALERWLLSCVKNSRLLRIS